MRAATSTISPSGAPRAWSEGSSQPTGTRPATSPRPPRPASKLRSALFAPAISTTLPSARPAAWRAALPADPTEWLRLRWPLLDRALFQVNDMLPLVLSRDALKASLGTVLRQSMPAPFDHSGVRLFGGQEETLRRLGGVGHLIRSGLGSGAWGPSAQAARRLMYCFTNANPTGMTMFDPFRFMLRQAYAEGTDLRMFVTPVHAVVRTLQQALGLGRAI